MFIPRPFNVTSRIYCMQITQVIDKISVVSNRTLSSLDSEDGCGCCTVAIVVHCWCSILVDYLPVRHVETKRG